MSAHADLATLLAYWQGELDEAQESAFEEHFLGCDACARRLAEVEAIAGAVRGAFVSGRLGAIVTPTFVEHVRARGVRIREYRIPRNGSVNCSVAPEDQALFGRMQVPLEGVQRVDAIAIQDGEQRWEDVPFDPASGEVVLAPAVDVIRGQPAHRFAVRLVAVEPGGERVLGEYTFNHSPHR